MLLVCWTAEESANLLHLFAAATARIQVSALSRRGPFRDFNLATAVRIRTAITFSLLKCHDISFLNSLDTVLRAPTLLEFL
jgi:hypothetical protein